MASSEEKHDLRVGMIGLGCAKNLVDGELMLGHLEQAGVQITADPAAAEVVVVNTCGFITEAKQESIAALLELAEAKQRGEVQRIVVCGCLAQAHGQELVREIPEIDSLVGLDELEQIVAAVAGPTSDHIPGPQAAHRLYDHHQPRLLSTAPSAYLKVAEGCSNPCSFCTIPTMRGSYRSRPIDDLVAEAEMLADQGIGELILIAQDTTRYGEDLGLEHGLRRLIGSLLSATTVPWIRFLYAYPATLDQGLFELMARQERLVPYLDIPLQHASRRVLKAMRRGGDAGSYSAMIRNARAMVPDLAVRTTFIVGFPGEGEAEFAELLDFVETIGFDHVGVFCYSLEDNSPGASLGDPVPTEVKQERRDRLMELQQGLSAARNQALIGRVLPALVSGPLPEMEILTGARLQRHAPEIDGHLIINDGTAAAGSLVEVEITEAHPYDLVGRLVRVLSPPQPPARAARG